MNGVYIVTTTELEAALDSAAPPVLLDVRWALGDPDGHQHYLDAHIPGAIYVDLETELAAPASPDAGRHPLPDCADFQRAARRWGICADQPVVVYDDNGNMSAARAWWLLRWAGITRVAMLDGGLPSWRRPTESGEHLPRAVGDVTLSAGHMPILTPDAASALPDKGILLDARAAERFTGASEPIDPRAGHIPGAISAPTAANLAEDKRFHTSADLRARFTDLGILGDKQVGVYCGSGVTAAHQIAALAMAGIDAALYPGSWSQWSADPTRPIATDA